MSDNVGEPPRMSSLRGAYSPTVNEWTFVATPALSTSPTGSVGPSSSSSTWTASPPPNRAPVFDLSPYPYDGIDPGGSLDAKGAFKWLVSAAILQYATTGIAMPFEVAKILMQCQWIPKEAVEGERPDFIEEDNEEHDSDDKEDSVRHDHSDIYSSICTVSQLLDERCIC